MPRNYKRTSSRATSYTKEELQIAIEKINNKELTYAAASKIYGIPTSTLSDRILRKTAIVSATLGRPTAIPMELENKLASCLRTIEKWGWGLSREEVLELTQDFIKRNHIKTPFNDDKPGPDWFISFRKRHNLSIQKPQPVEYLRKKMTDPFIINEYFTLLKDTLHELNISDPKHIWNLDETSVCLDPTKTKVVGAIGQPCTRTTYGSAKENITVLTTVNAAGQKLDPLIIFKGKHMYEQWMLENPEKYDFELAYAASKRGWIENDIFYDYMLKIIIPNLGEERPVLLLYDGHVSHVNDKVVALAVENNITILKLPAHTSHLLQPLDLAVFKSFKSIWDKNLVKWQRQNVGIKVRKQHFAKLFAEAWQETKPHIIQNGFEKGGIYPFNPVVIPSDKCDPAAYARWQRFMRNTLKQPNNLISICLAKINKNFSPVVKNNIPRTLVATFEQLFLEKVSQQPQNSNNFKAVKLKRVAKSAEVITKSFLQKQREEAQLTVHKSKNNAVEPIPGPSGIQKENVKILTKKNDNNLYNSKKGKGVGKRTQTGKENVNRNDSNVSNFRKKSKKNEENKSRQKKLLKKRKRNNSSTTTVESVQVSVHSDSDLLDLSDILSDCDNFKDYEENKTDLELTSREQQIEQIIKEIHDFDNNKEKNPIQRDQSIWEEEYKIDEIHKIETKETNVQANDKNKVTILSSVKLTPENQAFYKIHGSIQLSPIDKDLDFAAPLLEWPTDQIYEI